MGNKVASPCCGSCEYWKCREEWFCCYFQFNEKKEQLIKLRKELGEDWLENNEAYELD